MASKRIMWRVTGGVIGACGHRLLLCAAFCCGVPASAAETARQEQINVTTSGLHNPTARQPRIIREFYAQHPGVRLKRFSGVRLPKDSAIGIAVPMAMAGNVGPDIFNMDVRQAVQQGLAYPLTEWIGKDGVLKDGTPKRLPDGAPDINGRIDDDEAIWPGWKDVPEIFRPVATVDGIPYALPPAEHGLFVGLLYSKRLLKAAGLNPMKPPRSWDEYARWCRRLYNTEQRRPGVLLYSASWAFAPWVAAAGGSIIVQERQSPTTGKVYVFDEQATSFIAPDTGEDLQRVRPRLRTNVSGPGCVNALKFYQRLRWAPWIREPATGEPVELTAQEAAAGARNVGDREIRFSPDQVIHGSVEALTTEHPGERELRQLGRTVGMMVLWTKNLDDMELLQVEPDDLGVMAFPGMTEQHRQVLQWSNTFEMIGKDVAMRGGRTEAERKHYRQMVWELLSRMANLEGLEENVRSKVASGRARFVNPRLLKQMGLEDYLREIPPENLLVWDDVESGRTHMVIEPYMGKWLLFRSYLTRDAIDPVLREAGKNLDVTPLLERLDREAAAGTMFERPREVLDAYRPTARAVAAVVAAVLAFFLWLIVRSAMRQPKGSSQAVHGGWWPRFMLAPAIASIAMWGYYPLVLGLTMAFQDYQIAGKSPFVGLDNFIAMALSREFYHSVFTTFRFVLWNLALAFFTPIILALMLAEIPRLKVFFRTLFFLPQMTSGMVVSLMWLNMFDPGPDGTINRLGAMLFGWAGFTALDWLGDPRTAMACVIVPGVWAGAGISSLIYLAALKSVPEELYEAASVDGAGIWRRLRHIALPVIAPLIMINFVGAFIGTFQSMGSILLLTGPKRETMVLGMAIWEEAYVNLRFSVATSHAWVLGAILISFTYLQLRLLRRVEFRAAAAK